MKKSLITAITFTLACTSAMHGMDTSLSADMQKKYNNLTVLIQNADAEAFKPAFDALTLPAEHIAALEQTVLETKTAVTKEIEAMGNKNKNWSKIIKGGLGSWCGLSGAVLAFAGIDNSKPSNLTRMIFTPAFLANSIISYLANKYMEKKLNHPNNFDYIFGTLGVGFTVYGLKYGIENLIIGLNYKQHLQNMLANLDAIDAHIAQAKA